MTYAVFESSTQRGDPIFKFLFTVMKFNLKTILTNVFNPPLKLTEDESRVKTVIEKLLQNPDTKFRIAPRTHAVLLKQKETGFYLAIDGNQIKICNHNFALHTQYRLSFVELMRELVFDKIEYDRQNAMSEIFDNQQNLLENIIKTLHYAEQGTSLNSCD